MTEQTVVAKRGPGRPSKDSMIRAAREKHNAEVSKMTDAQILSLILDRFGILVDLTKGASEGIPNSAVASGAPGIGKSHTTEKVLEQLALARGTRYEIMKGKVTPIQLYQSMFKYQNVGDVLVLDDADTVLDNTDGLNLLKAALDSGDFRKISWRSEANVLKHEGIPTEFIYNGSILFLTNRNFPLEMEYDTKNREHYEALMNRTLYLDLKLHTPRELMIWIRHLVVNAKILINMGLDSKQEKLVLDYLEKNRDNIRTLSIRTAKQVATWIRTSPEDWERRSNMTLLK